MFLKSKMTSGLNCNSFKERITMLMLDLSNVSYIDIVHGHYGQYYCNAIYVFIIVFFFLLFIIQVFVYNILMRVLHSWIDSFLVTLI